MTTFTLDQAYGAPSPAGAPPGMPAAPAGAPAVDATAGPSDAGAAFSLDDAYKASSGPADNIPKGWMIKPGRDGYERIEELYNPDSGKISQYGVKGANEERLGERDIAPGEFDAPRAKGTETPNPAAIEPEKPDAGPVAHAANIGARGFNEGLAQALGMPVDLVNGAMNLGRRAVGAGETDKPVGGSEWIKDRLASVGMLGTEEPHEASGRILIRIGQELGGLAVPMGGELAAATRAGTKPVKTLLGPLVEPMRAAPVKTAATEAALGTTAGGGAGGLREAVDPNDPRSVTAADLVGALLGGVVPVGAASAARRAASKLPAITRAGRETRVAKSLDVTPLRGSEVTRAGEEAPQIEGVHYDTAALLDDPEMMAQLRAESRRGGSAVAEMVRRRQANATALRAQREVAAPDGTAEDVRPALQRRVGALERDLQGGVDQATESAAARTRAAGQTAEELAAQARAEATHGAGTARAEADALRTDAEGEAARRGAAVDTRTAAEVEAAQAEADQARAALGAGRPAGEASTAAREELLAARTAAERQASKFYAEVGPGGTLDLPTGYVAEAKNQIAARQGEMGSAANLPAVMRDGRIDKLGDHTSFQTLVQLGSELKNEARMVAPSGNRILLGHIHMLQEAVDKTLDDLASGVMPLRKAATDQAKHGAETGLPAAVETPNSEAAAATARGPHAEPGTSEAAVEKPGLRADGNAARAEAGSSAAGADRTSGRTAGLPEGGEAVPAGSGRPGGVAGGGEDVGLAETAQAVLKRRLADQWFKENVAEKFRRGPVAQVLKRGPGGAESAIAPSTTLEHFVKPGEKGGDEAIGAFVKAAGDRPAAVQALRDFMVDRFADFARQNGKVSAVRMAEFVDRYAPVFKQFPELGRDLKNVADLQRRVDAVLEQRAAAIAENEEEAAVVQHMAADAGKSGIAQAERAGRATVTDAERAGRAGVAAAEKTGGEMVKGAKARMQRSLAAVQDSAARFWLDQAPTKAVGSVLGAADPVAAARHTMSFVRRDPEAVAGVARAAWDHVMAKMFSAVEGEGIKVARSREFLTKNEAPLRVLMGDEAFDRAERLVKAAEINARVGNAKTGAGSDTAETLATLAGAPHQESVLGKIIHGIATAGGAAAGHVFGGGEMGAAVGGMAGHAMGDVAKHAVDRRVTATMRLFQEALIDPQVYQTLVARVTKNNEKALADRLALHIHNLGIASSNKSAEQSK